VRPAFRSPAAFLVAAALAAGVPLGFAIVSCSTGAVGVQACRDIETARCQAAAACGFSADQVSSCTLFYRDQCLDGIQNTTDNPPSTAEIQSCIAAVEASEACAQAGVPSMVTCGAAPLVDAGEDDAYTPCSIILTSADQLEACSWVTLPPDAGTPTVTCGDAGEDGDAADSGEGGDASEDADGSCTN
jgi:hypothetical protein